MIGDVIGLSLRQPNHVVPVEVLLGNCDGSRMPLICSENLTPAVAQKIVEVCPTAALELKEYQGQRCLSLSYGRCTGCGRCIDVGGDAVVPAKHIPWRGIASEEITRYWNLDNGREIVGTPPSPAEARGQIHSLLQRALNMPARRGVLQRLRGGDHGSHESLLRSGTIRNSLRGVTETCRYAACDRARHAQHGRSSPSYLRGGPGA